MSMTKVVKQNRLEQLEELLMILAQEIDDGPGARDMASLAKQYRETLHDIDELRGADTNGDEIAQILQKRGDNGEAGAVRANRT